MELPFTFYLEKEPVSVETLDLCRGEDDYRMVYLVDDGKKKLVIKRMSNTFSDRRRIEGWFRLMESYRQLGLYCPQIVPGLSGELLYSDTIEGRTYHTYAEEFARYETAEHIGADKYTDAMGHECFMPTVLRVLGKIGAARLDFLDFGSAYCLLEPFCAPDTTDEATECACKFVEKVEEFFPEHLPRAKQLLELFYKRQDELRAIYPTLPTSCFQGDLNNSNLLLDENGDFVGLIDFNLCGREPVLNYAVREALWGVSDTRLFGENDRRLYLYDRALDKLRIELFLENMRYVEENYTFSPLEREAFPILFRYMNSFWWHHLDALHELHREWDTATADGQPLEAIAEKVTTLLDWLEYQMNRDDIRLP